MFFTVASVVSTLALGAIATVHDVDVGKDGLQFTPPAIFADVGDQVVFHFHPKNHTATQSSFADPCTPAPGGFDSGFMFVSPNSTDAPPTYSITVKDEKPIWVFCNQAANTPNSHCGAAMIFSVNCPADPAPNSFDNFKKEALAIGAKLKADAAAANASASASASSGYGSPYGSDSAAASPTEQASATWAGYGSDYVTTAPYGDVTVTLPPPASVATVTETISAKGATWTTTYASYPNSPNPTPNPEPVVHAVTVGDNAKLLFDPPTLVAQPGDIVQFTFKGLNHSVVQSTFQEPCSRLPANETTGVTGFNSGFQFVGNSTNFLTVNMTVNSTAPTWFYCSQGANTPKSHCGAGMVFAVNSDEKGPRNFAAYQSLAKALNGTSLKDTTNTTGTGTASAAGSSPTSGAASMSVSASVLLGAVAFAFAALL